MANESLHIECWQAKDVTKLQNHEDIHLFHGCSWRQLILFCIPILRTCLFGTNMNAWFDEGSGLPFPVGGYPMLVMLLMPELCKHVTLLPPGSPVLGQQIKNCTRYGPHNGMPWHALLVEQSWIESTWLQRAPPAPTMPDELHLHLVDTPCPTHP